MKNSYSSKKKNIVKTIILSLVLFAMSMSILAIYSQGFKEFNPYGWFDKFEYMQIDYEIGGFELDNPNVENDSSNFIHSDYILAKNVNQIEISKKDNVEIHIFCYDANKLLLGNTAYITETTITEFNSNPTYIKIFIRNISSEITQDTISDYSSLVKVK